MLRTISSKTIICSGVSVASMDMAMLYLRYMSDVTLGQTAAGGVKQYWFDYHREYLAVVTGAPLLPAESTQFAANSPAVALRPLFPKCERNGVDQGVHNVLVHTQMIPGLNLFWQDDGPVSNMQGGKYQTRVEAGRTVVFNKAGQVYKVAHQYDRNKLLTAELFKRVSEWRGSLLTAMLLVNNGCSILFYSVLFCSALAVLLFSTPPGRRTTWRWPRPPSPPRTTRAGRAATETERPCRASAVSAAPDPPRAAPVGRAPAAPTTFAR